MTAIGFIGGGVPKKKLNRDFCWPNLIPDIVDMKTKKTAATNIFPAKWSTKYCGEKNNPCMHI